MLTRTSILIIGILLSFTSYGQDTKMSLNDSMLLKNFWTDFTTAVKTNNKDELTALCKFSFYCRPCIDDTTLKQNDHVTIKVTEKLFVESQYKLFLGTPIKNLVNKYPRFETYLFKPAFDDKNKPNGFIFPYTIVAPSKRWEGIQGFIYLEKVNNKYLIAGIDTVP
jgi:hypothetical protein